MRKIFVLVGLLVCLTTLKAQYKNQPRLRFAGGAEMGWTHNGELGNDYHQNNRSLRFIGEVIYRFNGLNHFVISGGYSRDSLTFRNHNAYLSEITQGYGHMQQFKTNGLIKMQSAWLGAAYLLSIGPPMVGLDIQLGASGRYIFESVRYDLPDEDFMYRLKDEIQPFNIYLQPKLAIRLSYFRFAASYEVPLFDHIDHDYLIKSLPYEHRSADMRGLRMDQPLFFLSASVALPVGKAIKLLNKALESKMK